MADEKSNPQNEEVPQSVAARRLKGLSGTSDPTPELPPAGTEDFWGNFWYHHKWKTIFVSILTVIVVICTLQVCSKETYDVHLLYAGPAYLTANEARSVQDTLSQIMPDYNEDGKRAAVLSTFNYLNDTQIAEKLALAEKEGVDVSMDYVGNANVLQQFQFEVMSGESVIYLLDPALYASVREAGGLIPLSEIFDALPMGTLDDYGIRFSETELYKSVSAFRLLPEDTVLCIRRVSTMAIFKDLEKTERAHADHVDLFIRMVNFSPEG